MIISQIITLLYFVPISPVLPEKWNKMRAYEKSVLSVLVVSIFETLFIDFY